MGIAIKCPHGHKFKVKDKYAGKKGLCPYCKGQVFVRVPTLEEAESLEERISRAASAERVANSHEGSLGDSSIFDDMPKMSGSGGSSAGSGLSGSLVGSSAVRHNINCSCGESVPMWFAKCPKCGVFLDSL
ncbi:MAG: hypothetical protein RH917_09810 [Lacipirellulaceae bacterium]